MITIGLCREHNSQLHKLPISSHSMSFVSRLHQSACRNACTGCVTDSRYSLYLYVSGLYLYKSRLYLYISRLEIESRTDLEDSALLAAPLMLGEDLLACLANRLERLCSQTLHIRQHARTERSFLLPPAQSAFYLLQQACLPCCLSPSRHHRPPRCFGKSRPHRCQRTAEPAVSLKRDGRLCHFLKNKGGLITRRKADIGPSSHSRACGQKL